MTARTTGRPQENQIPAHTAGQRRFLLDVPYEERALAQVHGAKWQTGIGYTYVGPRLPDSLRRYAPRPYSWAAWMDDDMAQRSWGKPAPDYGTGSYTLRPDQVEDTQTILSAYRAGAPEALIGSFTGVGKTATAIAVAKRLPGVSKILVIAPYVVLASWRNHLREIGDGGRRWCLINPESLKQLIHKPTPRLNPKTGKPIKSRTGTANKRHSSTGRPKVAWDLVIFDESHLLANPSSQRTIATDRIIEGPQGKPALSMRLSATAGTNPAELAYLHRGLAFASGEPIQPSIKADRYAEWCRARGVSVTVSKRFGEEKLTWEENTRDLTIFNRLIYGGTPTWAIRRKPEGWPEQDRVLVPIELTPAEMDAYETAWEEFTHAMKALRSANGASAAALKQAQRNGLAAQIRYRQKAGILRAPYSVAYAQSLHANGFQVAISCEFIDAVEAIRDGLTAAGHTVSIFTGRNKESREDERIAFQRGQNKFIIFTPDSSFDLHQGDQLVGGNDAPRALVVAQPRWSPKKALQVEGRTQRSGQSARAHYLFAQDTQEVKVLRAMISGIQSISVINGDDATQILALKRALNRVASALGAPMVIDSDD